MSFHTKREPGMPDIADFTKMDFNVHGTPGVNFCAIYGLPGQTISVPSSIKSVSGP